MIRLPVRADDFSLLPSVRTDSGAHPVPCSVGTGRFFPFATRLSCAADNSLPFSAQVENEWS